MTQLIALPDELKQYPNHSAYRIQDINIYFMQQKKTYSFLTYPWWKFPRPPIIRYPRIFPIFRIRRGLQSEIKVSLISDNF